MGIDIAVLTQLLSITPHLEPNFTMVMLGRQKLHITRPHFKTLAEQRLRQIGQRTPLSQLSDPEGYTEPLFRALGAGQVDSLDFSDFEGATHVHDLNDPIPDSLEGTYDFVFDGGTLEHVFDVKTSMTNAYRLLKDGGIFMSMAPGNNWFGHGFYQFSPELVFAFWVRACNCELIDCMLIPERPRDKPWRIEDPTGTGNRVRARGKLTPQRSYLFYAVRKSASHGTGKALQGDYVSRWQATG
ncbi:class I SAM-dependent methyltransferase [Oceanomicrobium pacificus]|uniref:Methyltransferase domain-containing protein n=1 Tax=Oceanomicrobium pacificus TaxID=2692916 RepID=A0A6B0TKV8_9RHOB|nr:class I SAM-dependent methyltransferase [Oceanomicrobium pacificus]MXU65127.1 methyltransferase domain-containing protein [Oceanomicrobium pacificus]